MPKVIADLFQRKPFRQEVTGTGVAKGVGSKTRDFEVEAFHPHVNQRTQAGCRKRSERRRQPQEHLTPVSLRANLLQIKSKRFADLFH